MIASLYLRRPTPEYGQAFDLAAVSLNQPGGPVLAVLSSSAHAAEILKRCPQPVDFASTGSFDAVQFVAEAQAWAWGTVNSVTLDQTSTRYAALLWAEPEATSAHSIARALRRLAAPGAKLSVIASSLLRRFLPAWQASPYPARQPLMPGNTVSVLRAEGWHVTSQTAFHGPRAIGWSTLYRLAERLGRPDWADRCLFAMRSNYREPGWLWPFAPLALIHARAA